MGGITLITYNGSSVTAQHDALIADSAVSDGMFFGAAVTPVSGDNHTIHVSHGIGILRGREFEIDDQDLSVTLPDSELNGRLYVHIDLSNQSTPIEFRTVLAATLPALENDDDINSEAGEADLEIATFKASSANGITSLIRTVSDVQGSGAVKLVTRTGTNLDDYIKTGIYFFDSSHTPIGIPVGVNGWLRVMQGDGFTKQIWYRAGTPGSNDHQTYIRTKNGSTWGSWDKYVTEKWLPELAHITTYATSNDGDGILLSGRGTTIVGAGEAGSALVSGNINGAALANGETLHIASDYGVYIYSNCNTIGNRKQMTFNTSGNLSVPGVITTGGKEIYPITYVDVTVNLHTATWRQATGLYYAEKAVSGWKWIFGLTIVDWGGLPAMVTPYIASASKIAFMSTTNSFPSANASIRIRIMGVLS